MMFHPKEPLANYSSVIFTSFRSTVPIEWQEQINEEICGLTIKFISGRFDFLKKNKAEIDEKGSIKFDKTHEIVKNNRDSYVDILLRGLTKIVDNMFSLLSYRIDLFAQLLDFAMNAPK